MAWMFDDRPVICSASLADVRVLVANETIAPEQALNVLNGNLVYLCRKTDVVGVADDDDDNVECFGIGE